MKCLDTNAVIAVLNDRPAGTRPARTGARERRAHPLSFDLADAEHAGAIRTHLERAGTPIGHYDLLIAAQARRHGATLVTANQREFARVPGLDVVDRATP
jgi:predicted nucleic acid-binding protein